MTQLSLELAKQGWGAKQSAGHDSDSSAIMTSPEIQRDDPTPSQGHKKRNGHVARRLQFGGNDSEEGSTDSESDAPPKKQSKSMPIQPPPPDPKAVVTNADNRTGIDQALAQLLEEVKKTNTELSGVSSRLQSVEKRLEVIEEDGVVSSSSADSTKKKRRVPNKVRVRMALEIEPHSCLKKPIHAARI